MVVVVILRSVLAGLIRPVLVLVLLDRDVPWFILLQALERRHGLK